MMKLLFIVLFLSLDFRDLSASTDIHCKYDYWDFNVLESTYHCDVIYDPNIKDQESAEISSIQGTHENSETDNNVLGFYANDKTIKYFPRGLELFFHNLKAIFLSSCKLKEIHQSDLKPFSDLIYLSFKYNEIEVIEEGLFDFNPKIETIVFYESNIVHIDADVFDNLRELVNFWFSNVPCINRDIEDSRTDVESAIESMKIECVNYEFSTLDEEFKALENNLNYNSFEEFKERLENFENKLKVSKFFKFRPFNYKFEVLKSNFYSNYQDMSENLQQSTSLAPQVSDENNGDFEELKSSHCDMKSFFSDIKTLQSNFENSFAELKNSQTEQKAALSTISSSISDNCHKNDQTSTKSMLELTTTLNNLSNSQNTTTNTLKDIKDTLEALKSSQNILKSSQESIKSSQDNLHSSMSDMEVILSDLKKTQNEFKDALMKIKNSQNEMRISLNDISSNKNLDDKVEKFDGKFGNFDGKLANIETHFVDLKTENTEKFVKIEKDLFNTRHKISVNFDEKVKGIEKRLIKKFEEILEDKLGKILEDKLGSVLDNKSGK